jgi:hypothetical protein
MDRRIDPRLPTPGRYDDVSFRRAVWLKRRFTVPRAAEGRPLFLRMSRPTWYFKLFLDGRQIAGDGLESATGIGATSVAGPAVVRLADRAKAGSRHQLVFAVAEPYPTTAMGELTLEAGLDPQPVKVRGHGPGACRIITAAGEMDVVYHNPEGAMIRAGRLATDAAAAVLKSNGHWAAVDASAAAIDGEQVLRCRYGRASLSYGDGVLAIDRVDRGAVCDVHLHEGAVSLFGEHRDRALAVLTKRLDVLVRPQVTNTDAPNLLCPQVASAKRRGERHLVHLMPAKGVGAALKRLVHGNAFEREEAINGLAGAAGEEAVKALIGALDDPRWTMRAAAANALGRRMEAEAVEPLIEALAAEERDDVYRGIYDQKLFADWPGGSSQREITDYRSMPPEAREIPERGTVSEFLKRWRVKQAVIESLGLIGDARAVGAIARILDATGAPGELGMSGKDFYPVRKAATEALGLIGDPSAAEVLEKYADERELNTCFAARKALSFIRRGRPAR